MDLGTAIYKGLTGRLPTGEKRPLVLRMDEMERLLGSRRAAREAAGVSQRTWERWRSGAQRPSAAKLSALRLAQRRARLNVVKEQHIRGRGWHAAPAGLTIKGRFQVSSEKSRERTINPGPFMPPMVPGPDVFGPMIDAYLRGDDQAAAAILEAGVNHYYVNGLNIEDVEWVRW